LGSRGGGGGGVGGGGGGGGGVGVGVAVAVAVVVAVVRAVAGAERRVQQSTKGWQRLQLRQWQPWQR
jgi:hypothetical protein